MWLKVMAGSTGAWTLSRYSGEELTFIVIMLAIFFIIAALSLIVIPFMAFRSFLTRLGRVRPSTVYVLLLASVVLTAPFSLLVRPYYPALLVIMCFIFWVSLHAAEVFQPFATVRLFMGSMLIGVGVFSVLLLMFLGIWRFMQPGVSF